MTTGLKDRVEDLGFMPSMCVHTSSETSRSLSSIFGDVGHVYCSYNWAHIVLITSRKHSLLFW